MFNLRGLYSEKWLPRYRLCHGFHEDMNILNPINYKNWDRLLLECGDSQFFHTRAWAQVLKETYGYEPAYFALFKENKLAFVFPFAEVNSIFTGRRGISLPFSDFCPPFVAFKEIPSSVAKQIRGHGERANWRYFECRAAEIIFPGQPPSQTYFTHDLNLARTDHEFFSDFKANTRRNIKKAERSGLTVNIDNSLLSVKYFYRLNCLTRRRLGYPSQPFSFFRQVHKYAISQGYGIVVSAFLSNTCVAAAVYFFFGDQAIFKFGASDLEYQYIRPNNLVMWEAIKWLRDRGIQTMSFGRTNLEDRGLLRYKRSWGTIEKQIGYYRYDLKRNDFLFRTKAVSLHREIFQRMPIPLLRLIGRLAYKHLG